ncbi:MAG: DUF3078 domain-containing protein [Capnocytophaga sp.]|nr:DUF3078 domain-containing protein [Capnocytophaga sp.]
MTKHLLTWGLLMVTTIALGQIRRANEVTMPLKITPLKVREDPEALRFTFKRFQQEQDKWFRFNQVNLNMSEVALSNWSAGGNSSISGLMNAKFRRRLSEKTYFWDNELELNYGMNVQEGQELRKTDDRLAFASTLGYRGNWDSFWYFTAKFQFNTQISNGYSYPNKETPISRFLAPGYMYLGLGIEYAPDNRKFNLFLSPLTLKTTLVLDQDLADRGAFGVKAAQYDANGAIIKSGANSNSELGFLVNGSWSKKIAENINMSHVFNLYGDYLKNFGNIDIDWEMNFNLKVNNYVQARLGTHIRYDDDVKFKQFTDANGVVHNYGARIQLKQILGVGVSYTF